MSHNLAAYHRWCITRHKRAAYVDATMERVNMASNWRDVHKSFRPSEIRRSETEVTNIIAAFKQFLNPFRIESNNHHLLFCLSSGKPASDEVSEDLLKYVNVGKKATETFIRTRLVEKSVKFHDTMKKLKLMVATDGGKMHTYNDTEENHTSEG